MTTTAAHLSTVICHWPDLVEALGGASAPTWPPAGRMSDYLRALEEQDLHLVAIDHVQKLTTLRDETGRTIGYRCHRCGDTDDPGHTHPIGEERDPAQLGVRPIPIRLPVHETMRIVRAALLHCADAIAETVQRPPMKPPPPRRASYARTRAERLAWEDHARRVQAAQDDAADARRWRWTGRRPDAPYTALWLLGRVQGAPGPFRPLSDAEAGHIAVVARGAADRVERALDVADRVAPLAQLCPRLVHGVFPCGGRIEMHGGAGADPVAHCTKCGHVWSGQGAAVA